MLSQKISEVTEHVVGAVGEAIASVLGQSPKPKSIPIRTQPETRKPR